MKTNCWLILGTMLASSVIAQNNTNTLPEMPAPVTSPAAEMTPASATAATPAAAPAKQKKRATARAKAVALKEPTVMLVPGPAEVAVSNLIVRSQAGLKGEVVAHLFKGDTATVLNQINLDKHATGEPAQWAKIAYPTNAHVWVNAKYVDAANSVVSIKKLNLRAGPGENFSVVGVLEKGTPVSQVSTKNGWMRIDAPANAYAFVAAMYLKQEAPAPAMTEPVPMPTPVPAPQPIVTEPINPPAEPTMITPTTRNVSHEGVVRHVGSLITPTEYELYDPTTDKNVDFLYTTTTNLNLSRYVGMRIIVTGTEELAARWQDIPVLTVERIQVIDTNAVPQRIYRSPGRDNVIDGRAIAAQILRELAQRVAGLKRRGVTPGLAFVRVGEDPASKVYVGRKEKACAELGLFSETHVLPEKISEAELLALISRLNSDPRLHGILVQAPLPKAIRESEIYSAVSPGKDVDGFHPVNVGKLMLGDPGGFRPCTPAGIVELLARSNVKTEGAEVVVLGRGNIVGKPMAAMLCQKGKNANATVTICHSATRDIQTHCRRADILIAAMGVAGFVKAGMVKPGATVIDVGVNRVDGKLVGDVDFATVQKVAGKITPNPGGVGPMTIAMLMSNTVRAAELSLNPQPSTLN